MLPQVIFRDHAEVLLSSPTDENNILAIIMNLPVTRFRISHSLLEIQCRHPGHAIFKQGLIAGLVLFLFFTCYLQLPYSLRQ